MKVALAYDRVNKWGGAESVLLALHQIYPDAPLFTSVYDREKAPWASVFDVRTSFLQKTPLPKDRHEYYPFLMGPAFETFNLDQFDMVISVTHEFAKAIVTKPKTFHLCYCLTPTSYLWSGYDAYFSSLNRGVRTISQPVIKYLRFYDRIVAHRPDKYLAISQTVSGRIKKYYSIDSDVIYPPVEIAGRLSSKEQPAQYFLIVSRLVPNKRLDLALKAFNELKLPLKIVGTGRDFSRLKGLAGPTIEFLGYLTANQLKEYYKHCRALIVPAEEDFGIVAVEAQGYGKPVIAYGRGGSRETVINGKTGWLFNSLNLTDLVAAVKRSLAEKIDPTDCWQNARKFDQTQFQQIFQKKVSQLYRRYQENYA